MLLTVAVRKGFSFCTFLDNHLWQLDISIDILGHLLIIVERDSQGIVSNALH